MRCTMADINRVNRILDNQDVSLALFGHSDGSSGVLGYRFLSNDSVLVLMPNEGCLAIGVPHNNSIYHFHIAVLPGYRGKQAVIAFKEAAQWVFENTPCIKIVGLEPTVRKDAVRFILALGFEKEGLLKNACPTGDVAVLGLCA